MKKFLALLLSLVMVLALVACGDKKDDTNTDDQDNNEVTDFKVGFIMLHDENSTYDLNFINAAKEACETLGVEYTIVTNVPEGQECYDKAAELADAGCNIIFADSFGHEDYMIQAAKDFPDVQFCHSTGTKAHTEGLANYHNAFAAIYEGRYLAGIAAGLKLIGDGSVSGRTAWMNEPYLDSDECGFPVCSDELMESAIAYMQNLGLPGFCQERTSAKEEYTPDFDLTGV